MEQNVPRAARACPVHRREDTSPPLPPGTRLRLLVLPLRRRPLLQRLLQRPLRLPDPLRKLPLAPRGVLGENLKVLLQAGDLQRAGL